MKRLVRPNARALKVRKVLQNAPGLAGPEIQAVRQKLISDIDDQIIRYETCI